MAGDAARRLFAHGADGVGAALRADRPFIEIRLNVFLGRNIGGGFIFFQHPLLFGGVNHAKVVDATV